MKTTKKILSLALAIAMALCMAISSSAYLMSNRYSTIYYGNTEQLTINKDLTYDDVTFVSSDPSVASVDAEGKVRSNGLGECVITCTNNETGESEECTIHVVLVWWKPIQYILYFFKNLPNTI